MDEKRLHTSQISLHTCDVGIDRFHVGVASTLVSDGLVGAYLVLQLVERAANKHFLDGAILNHVRIVAYPAV
jgi:hypothetical protein